MWKKHEWAACRGRFNACKRPAADRSPHLSSKPPSCCSTDFSVSSSLRWVAPERLSIFDGSPEPAPHTIRVTKESDMYSLAMVVIEVYTTLLRPLATLCLTVLAHGSPRYADIHRKLSVLGHSGCRVILKLAQQKCPKKPEGAVQLGLTNPIWETVEICWKTQPSDRLTAARVLEIWEKEVNDGGTPKEVEETERKHSRRLSDFRAGKKSPLSPLRLPRLISSTPS